MLMLSGGVIAGADTGGTRFDGPYDVDPGNRAINGSLKVQAPPNGFLLQGVPTGEQGLSYDIRFSLPENFGDLPFVTLETPYGPINVRFKKLRNLP